MKTTNFVKIDGAKFTELIEGASGKTLKEISLENGFSDAFLRMVVKSGKASPSAQAVARLYGIEPSAYELKEEPQPTEEAKQMSIDDYTAGSLPENIKAEIKALIRDTFIELLFNGEFLADYNPVTNSYRLVGRIANRKEPDGVTIRKPLTATEYLKQLEKDDN